MKDLESEKQNQQNFALQEESRCFPLHTEAQYFHKQKRKAWMKTVEFCGV